MPISSYIATLSRDPEQAREAKAALAEDPRVELGEQVGDRVPFVVETATPDEDAQLTRALLARDGVLAVDLVFVDFSDINAFDRDAFRAATRTTRA